MKKSDLLRLVLIGLLATQSHNAQSRAYAKFGAGGETIGLFNLSKQTEECESSSTFVGTVISLHAQMRERETDYRFAIRSNSARVGFKFVLDREEIPLRDVESLLGKRHAIRIRACRKGRRDWIATEIALIG